MEYKYGIKYEATKELRTPELLKLIRKDLKAEPRLSGFKISARLNYYGYTGDSLSIRVTSVPQGFTLWSHDYNDFGGRVYTEEASEPVLKTKLINNETLWGRR